MKNHLINLLLMVLFPIFGTNFWRIWHRAPKTGAGYSPTVHNHIVLETWPGADPNSEHLLWEDGGRIELES